MFGHSTTKDPNTDIESNFYLIGKMQDFIKVNGIICEGQN